MNKPNDLPAVPALAGIATYEEAMRPGLSVEECVHRLKRYHYAFKRLHEIFIHRLTSEPLYELKMAFSLHAHICAEHVTALRKRVSEMREPPLGLEAVPHPGLEVFFDELLNAPDTAALLTGIYTRALPGLERGLERHLEQTNPLADHPSVRICRFALLEVREMLVFGKAATAAFGSAKEAVADGWLDLLEDCLRSAGDVDGAKAPSGKTATRLHSAKPHSFDGVPRRDSRFPDPYNMGVNAEVFLYDETFPPEPKVLMMFYKRLREIDVPEMMASIIAETPGKSWSYYQDMTRQLWDEARHAMMGEVGFVSLNLNWPELVKVNHTWSLALNTQLKPIERHAVLYFIEQGLMPKTGKRFEWEVGLNSGNKLAALFQDYDWADEVLHARVGRDWYVKDFSDPQKAVRYGDESWSRVLMNWEHWREQGLTKHENWWPNLYKAFCKLEGVEPDPRVLAYSTSYQSIRADLKELTGSA